MWAQFVVIETFTARQQHSNLIEMFVDPLKLTDTQSQTQTETEINTLEIITNWDQIAATNLSPLWLLPGYTNCYSQYHVYPASLYENNIF